MSITSELSVGSGGSRGGAVGGGGDPLPPLVLDQTEARRAGKKCFWRPAPTFLRVWMTEPLPPLPQGLDPALH